MTEETVKIHFHITKEITDSLTWDDLDTIELARDGELKSHQLRSFLARFMVGEDLKPLPHDKAKKALGKVAVNQIKDVMQQFSDALVAGAIPPPNGRQSRSHSEASSEATLPDGAATSEQP